VLLGLGLLLAMSTFAERSSELRVDALTALAGLASLVLLLGRRPLTAGACCALSFLISQKGVYYVLAGNAALAAAWLFADRSKRGLSALVAFNAAAASVLAAYLGFWAALSSWDDVVSATFLSHGDIALRQLYDNRFKYWSQTLRRNPLFYLMALLGVARLAQGRLASVSRRTQITLAAYGATIIVLSLLHRQPWPYFFVLVVPTLWVLIVAFLDVELLAWDARPPQHRRALVALVVVLGFALPLLRVPTVLSRSNGYQRSTVLLADALLGAGESYLAGTELLFDRPQEIRDLAWLDIPRSQALSDEEPWETERRRQELAASSVKLVVNNYRIYGLPRGLRLHLDRTYEPWWGSIAIYSPSGEAGAGILDLRFPGTYEVVGPAGARVTIAGRTLAPGDRLALAAGMQTVDSDRAFRLRYVPQGVETLLDPRFRGSQLLFPDVYTY
jgi:hypothetical protein